MDKTLEVFLVFLKLGLTSFGGPVAHLGYFRSEFVARRRWLDDASYADLVALAQFLPGPSSSQVGMGLGLMRAGYSGMAAAWIGFTLPSALLLLGVAYLSTQGSAEYVARLSHGLMVVAVAVVAQAVFQMSQSLTPDWPRRVMALAAMAVLLLWSSALSQIIVLVAGAFVGYVALKPDTAPRAASLGVSVSRRTGAALILCFFVLLGVLPLLAAEGALSWRLADIFYRAGALVFGGGHVVLPILEASLVPQGLIAQGDFFAGYGAAQAVPGPLFSFAAYVGAVVQGGGVVQAGVCLLAMFAPSFLLVPGAMPFWSGLSQRQDMRAAMAGVNASVVGLLAAAFVTPVFTSAIMSVFDLAVALAAFAVLQWRAAPVWLVVVITGLAGLVLE